MMIERASLRDVYATEDFDMKSWLHQQLMQDNAKRDLCVAEIQKLEQEVSEERNPRERKNEQSTSTMMKP